MSWAVEVNETDVRVRESAWWVNYRASQRIGRVTYPRRGHLAVVACDSRLNADQLMHLMAVYGGLPRAALGVVSGQVKTARRTSEGEAA